MNVCVDGERTTALIAGPGLARGLAIKACHSVQERVDKGSQCHRLIIQVTSNSLSLAIASDLGQ
jgi:hypothetical protein